MCMCVLVVSDIRFSCSYICTCITVCVCVYTYIGDVTSRILYHHHHHHRPLSTAGIDRRRRPCCCCCPPKGHLKKYYRRRRPICYAEVFFISCTIFTPSKTVFYIYDYYATLPVLALNQKWCRRTALTHTHTHHQRSQRRRRRRWVNAAGSRFFTTKNTHLIACKKKKKTENVCKAPWKFFLEKTTGILIGGCFVDTFFCF